MALWSMPIHVTGSLWFESHFEGHKLVFEVVFSLPRFAEMRKLLKVLGRLDLVEDEVGDDDSGNSQRLSAHLKRNRKSLVDGQKGKQLLHNTVGRIEGELFVFKTNFHYLVKSLELVWSRCLKQI